MQQVNEFWLLLLGSATFPIQLTRALPYVITNTSHATARYNALCLYCTYPYPCLNSGSLHHTSVLNIVAKATLYILVQIIGLRVASLARYSSLCDYTLSQWYSNFLVRVPPHVISLQLCTPQVVTSKIQVIHSL
jgi:hypothetical protein